MTHSDKTIAFYFYKREIEMTNQIVKTLKNNGFKKHNLEERVHIATGIIDNLCHEIVYHKHDEIDYNVMTNIVIENIVNLIN